MRYLTVFLVMLVACASGTEEPSTTTGSAVTTVAVTSTLASTTTVPLEACPPAPYELSTLPTTVRPADDSDTVDEPDDFTSIGGTSVELWVDAGGATAIALVRGSLPPQQFPAERGEVDIDGSAGVAGPYPDGRWVVAWFNEPGERCDQYTIVFYPPISPGEVEQTIADMTRVPG